MRDTSGLVRQEDSLNPVRVAVVRVVVDAAVVAVDEGRRSAITGSLMERRG